MLFVVKYIYWYMCNKKKIFYNYEVIGEGVYIIRIVDDCVFIFYYNICS